MWEWCGRHVGIVLLAGLGIGLVMPAGPMAADKIALALTGLLVLFACPNLDLAEVKTVKLRPVLWFLLFRFAALPLVIYIAAMHLGAARFAEGALLLAAMPAGVAVASLCALHKGNVTLGLMLTVLSSLAAPVVVPLLFLVAGRQVQVDAIGLGVTLLSTILGPALLYGAMVARWPASRLWLRPRSGGLCAATIAAILAVVVTAARSEIAGQPLLIVEGLVVMALLFALLYAVGVVVALGASPRDRVTYFFASGAMNNTLAVGVGFFHFDATTALFLALSELIWALYVAMSPWLLNAISHSSSRT